MSTKPNSNPNLNPSLTLTLCAIVDVAPTAANTIWIMTLRCTTRVYPVWNGRVRTTRTTRLAVRLSEKLNCTKPHNVWHYAVPVWWNYCLCIRGVIGNGNSHFAFSHGIPMGMRMGCVFGVYGNGNGNCWARIGGNANGQMNQKAVPAQPSPADDALRGTAADLDA